MSNTQKIIIIILIVMISSVSLAIASVSAWEYSKKCTLVPSAKHCGV